MGDISKRPERSDFPTGTVTFLFTDIEGSTKLAQAYPEAMPGLLARHNEILQRSIQAQHGYVLGFAGLAVAEDHWERGTLLFAYTATQAHGPRQPVEQAPIERDMAVLRAQLGESRFDMLTAEGSTMSLEQAIDLALEY